jgi:hypothetical protein
VVRPQPISKELIDSGRSIENLRKEVSTTDRFMKAVETTKTADSERTIIAAASSNKSRQSITIEYFPKNVDKNKVELALKELGFKLKRSRAEFPNYPTNAIWFGVNVEIEDVKIVAYTLIRAGVSLQFIGPFKYPHRNHGKLIQIGSLVRYLDSPPLKIFQIKNAESFIREY